MPLNEIHSNEWRKERDPGYQNSAILVPPLVGLPRVSTYQIDIARDTRFYREGDDRDDSRHRHLPGIRYIPEALSQDLHGEAK
jgi:hypothetical protein